MTVYRYERDGMTIETLVPQSPADLDRRVAAIQAREASRRRPVTLSPEQMRAADALGERWDNEQLGMTYVPPKSA